MLHNSQKDFLKRHIGPSDDDQNKMLKELNYKSLDDLIKSTVPEKIQLKDELNIGESNSEYEALRKLKAISKIFEIAFNFLNASYSEFDSPIFNSSFNWIFSGTVLLIKSSSDL